MKTAIVFGGTEDHIRLIEILKEKGYYTYLIDYYENPPAKNVADEHIRESILDKEVVLEIAKEINPDLVITACIDQALLTMAYVSEQLYLPCHISYQTALELTNKVYMKQKFVENNIPTSAFYILNKIIKYEFNNLNIPLIIKPADSNSSKGVIKVFNGNELRNAIDQAFNISRSGMVVVEEYVEGEELSVDVVVADYEPNVILITKNIKLKQNEKNFTIVQNYYPATNDSVLIDKISEIAKNIAYAWDLENAPLLIQMIYDGKKLSVIEFSSRIGGGSKHHFIRKLTGFDILGYFIDILVGNKIKIKVKFKFQYACMNYIYTQPGIINSFVGIDALIDEGVIEQFFFYKTVGMNIDNFVASSDRPAGFMILAKSKDELQRKIEFADKTIQIRNQHDKDIMMHGIYSS